MHNYSLHAFLNDWSFFKQQYFKTNERGINLIIEIQAFGIFTAIQVLFVMLSIFEGFSSEHSPECSSLYLLLLHVCMVCLCVLGVGCHNADDGSQGTTLWSCFSPIFMWVPGIELRPPGLSI